MENYLEKNRNFDITVIVPALNEEKNIIFALSEILKTFSDLNMRGEIVVVNDGSTDNTEMLVKDIIKKDNRIRMIKHEIPKGIGASFWDGVDMSQAKAVVLIPGDNENYPFEVLRYFNLLDHVDIVIPFIFNKGIRGFFRNTLSFIYRFIINSTFKVNFNYTNGTVLYRKTILQGLNYRSKSFFFQTDILVRVVKRGYLFAEVPYKLGMRKDGISKAVSFPSLIQVIRGYLRLVRDYHLGRKERGGSNFISDTLTAKRRS